MNENANGKSLGSFTSEAIPFVRINWPDTDYTSQGPWDIDS